MGKILLAHRLMKSHRYPVSLAGLLKTGLIHSGQTELMTEDDKRVAPYPYLCLCPCPMYLAQTEYVCFIMTKGA